MAGMFNLMKVVAWQKLMCAYCTV